MPQLRTGKLYKKVCMLGAFAVGKTSLVRQFVYSLFSEDYLSTVGVQLSTKSVELKNSKSDKILHVNLILWDLAQLEKFDTVIKNYLHGSHAAIVVFDLTRPQTFSAYKDMIQNFWDINPDSRIVFAGNKTDLSAEDTPRQEIKNMAAELNCPVLFTSAKTAENVETVFQVLAQQFI